MAAHSRIGASSMDRWSQCPASVRLSQGIPNRSSKYAEEGTLAHDLAAKYLESYATGNDGAVIQELAALDKEIAPEMKEAVDVYVDYVFAILGQIEDPKILIEHRFDLSVIYPGLFGTADCVIYDPKRKHLYVFDYKHGMGIPVEVFEDGKANVQLSYYALGALLSTGFPCETVTLGIIQPRCHHPDGPVRTFAMPAIELIDFASDLAIFASRTEDPNAPIVPGDHCRFCPASPTCPKLHQTALVTAKQEFSAVTAYDPVKLSETLSMLPAIEGWVKSVREFAYHEAQAGRSIPGWKLVPKRATRRWRDELEAEMVFANHAMLDVFETPKMKSPAQIEKAFGGKEGKRIVDDLTISVSSGFTLAPESDKRPSKSESAKTDFTVITD